MTDNQVPHVQDLKRHYNQALKRENVEDIISCGTAYFNELRGGTMNEEDRDALQDIVFRISNDLELLK